MDVVPSLRTYRGRDAHRGDGSHRPQSRNKHWSSATNNQSSPQKSDGDKWERGGHRGGRGRAARGGLRKFPNRVLHTPSGPHNLATEDVDAIQPVLEEPVLETQEEREKFYQDLVKAREAERKKAIADGKMDDPLVPKRLEDAITMIGTCMDMCPRFERYRRERENNLTEWETVSGTKRVDHNRAVKMYERAAGDKTLPSDLRPPQVLKRTLDYLFHDLLPRGGFHRTFSFIRDRSRAVRNDFTMQHETGPLAMECHERCARFHILALHFERDETDFSIAMEEQQLMYALQSLKEFYGDQRPKYQSPSELEMRVYHRLIHIRDQRERHDDIPDHITSHPVFKLTTEFRLHVQKKSAPITKSSKLTVDAAAMEIFGRLAGVLREQGSVVMIYLVACILERLFGKDAIDDIESIRGDLEIPDIIDGMAVPYVADAEQAFMDSVEDDTMDDQYASEEHDVETHAPSPLRPSATEWLNTNIREDPTPPTYTLSTPSPVVAPTASSSTPVISSLGSGSAFAGLTSAPNPFATPSVFGKNTFGAPSSSSPPTSVFGAVFQTTPPASVPETKQSHLPSASSSSASFGLGNVKSTLTEPAVGQPSPAQPLSFLNPKPLQSQPTLPDVTRAASDTNASLSLNPSAPTFVPSLHSAPPLPPQADEPPAVHSSIPETHQFTASPVPLHATPSTSLLSPLPAWTPPASTSIPSASIPPSLPKLNTAAGFMSPGTNMASPRIPPALGRKQPISLPSTPIIVPPAAWPHLGFLRNGTLTPTSSMSSETLSPLFLQSPTVSRKNSMFDIGTPGTPSSSKVDSIAISSPTPAPSIELARPSSKGKEKATAVPFDKTVAQEKVASLRGRRLVGECFRLWLKRTLDRAALADAWRKSEEYRARIESQKVDAANGASPGGKRRRSSRGTDATPEVSPMKKRPKRVSDKYQPPRTDEELARRLKENQEEHERRWARGSFLQIVTTHVRALAHAKNSRVPPSWRAWVSLNPESDATAIWLERKFDIPVSGKWVSETAFEIPLSKDDASPEPGYPGLIVFECTPLDSIPDEIERKYRILDDCARLRDLLKCLPQERHFIPSLLILSWSGADQQDELGGDFLSMIHGSIHTSTVKSYAVFSFTADTKDVDAKFANSLNSLSCDVEGELVQILTIRSIFQLFNAPLQRYITDNLDRCFSQSEFNWTNYACLVVEYISLLNDLADCVVRLAGADAQSRPLVPFDAVEAEDSGSLYSAAFSWLAKDDVQDATDNIVSDLHSHRSMARDFPTTAFLGHLVELIRHRLESINSKVSSTFSVPRADIRAAVDSFSGTAEMRSKNFMEKAQAHLRKSPKRRSVSMLSDLADSGQPPSKRGRMSASVNGTPPRTSASVVFNGTNGVSPAVSISSSPYSTFSSTTLPLTPSPSKAEYKTTSQPNVTLAMLRALTKDVKMKYGATD